MIFRLKDSFHFFDMVLINSEVCYQTVSRDRIKSAFKVPSRDSLVTKTIFMEQY